MGRELGLRREIETRLRADWSDIPEAKEIRRITLHYHHGKIQVEIELPLNVVLGREDLESVQHRFEQAMETNPDVDEVRVLYS